MSQTEEPQPELTEIPEPELEILDMTDNPQNALPPAEDYVTGTPAEEKPKKEARDAKSGPPNAAEWQDFIGGTVLRLLTEGYLHLVLFREIDESELTSRERQLIRLERDDLRDMAAPMASFANKSKLARKHGRSIIAAGDSYESIIDLFIWMRRVNRIARKYRKNKPVIGEVVNGEVPSENVGPESDQSPNLGGIVNRGTG